MPTTMVRALRAAGHDVAWIAEDAPAVGDREVLVRAARETRLVLTFDKDFGELAFRAGLPARCGVILLRVAPDPEQATSIALRVLAGNSYEGGSWWSSQVASVSGPCRRWRLRSRRRLGTSSPTTAKMPTTDVAALGAIGGRRSGVRRSRFAVLVG